MNFKMWNCCESLAEESIGIIGVYYRNPAQINKNIGIIFYQKEEFSGIWPVSVEDIKLNIISLSIINPLFQSLPFF